MTGTDRRASRILGSHKVTRRSFVAGSAALAATSGLVRGASARQASSELSGELLMWAYPLVGQEEDGQMWEQLTGGFNEQHPDVEIKIELQPWDRRVEKLLTAMAAGIGPDVWYINIEDIPSHAKAGRLVALDDAFTAEDKADFYPASLEAMSWNGTLWASPILVAIYSSFYNTSVFAEAGVEAFPATWDDMRAAAPKFKDAGYYLTEYETGDPQAFFYPLIWQAGGEPYVNGEPAFNSPEGVTALEFVLELFNGDYAPESVTAAEGISITERPIGLGEVALGLPSYGSWDIQLLVDTWGEGVLEISAPPKNVQQVNTGGVGGYAVSAASENQDAGKAWVQYITNTAGATLINTVSGYLPPRISVGDIHAGNPVLSPLGATLPYMRAFPSVIGGRQILTDALAPEIEAAILGQKSAQEALDAAVARAKEIMAEQSEA